MDLEAYERLRMTREDERELFSRVIKRAVWPPREGTAAALLAWRREVGEEEILNALAHQAPPLTGNPEFFGRVGGLEVLAY